MSNTLQLLGREKQDQRKKDFKKAIDEEEKRKERGDQAISIRKLKRAENVAKKRNIPALPPSPNRNEISVQLKVN